MTLRDSKAFHIQNLIDLEPDCQVVELSEAEEVETELRDIKSLLLEKVLIYKDGSFALPMYKPSSEDIIESLKNLNKTLKEKKNETTTNNTL
jgi:hypothetical protein